MAIVFEQRYERPPLSRSILRYRIDEPYFDLSALERRSCSAYDPLFIEVCIPGGWHDQQFEAVDRDLAKLVVPYRAAKMIDPAEGRPGCAFARPEAR
jgi:hypothetical protein